MAASSHAFIAGGPRPPRGTVNAMFFAAIDRFDGTPLLP